MTDTQTELGKAIIQLKEITGWPASVCADRYLSNDSEALLLLNRGANNNGNKVHAVTEEDIRRMS